MSDETTSNAYHKDPRRFRDALTHTAVVTGFSERLIEKDYYCSVVLKDLEVLFGQGLVFKGGTCLSKVHADFFRLSEDLDFGISVKPDASRAQRRQIAEPLKAHLNGIVQRLPIFTESVPLTGCNNNKQYNGKLEYRSVITGELEAIKIEVSLREEVLLSDEELPAKTILIDPITGTSAVTPVAVRVLALREAYAEKTRAALTRREPALRDFFDLDSAIRKNLLNHREPEFIDLVSQKLARTEDRVDTSLERMEKLARQIEAQLKPVLRAADYEAFDLNRVVTVLHEVVAGCPNG